MKKHRQPVLLVSIIVLALVLGAYLYFFKPFTPEYRKEPVKNDELLPFTPGAFCADLSKSEFLPDKESLDRFSKFNLGLTSQIEPYKKIQKQMPYQAARVVYVANYQNWLKLADSDKMKMMNSLVDTLNNDKKDMFEVYFSTCIDGNSKPIGFVRNYNGEKKAYFDWN